MHIDLCKVTRFRQPALSFKKTTNKIVFRTGEMWWSMKKLNIVNREKFDIKKISTDIHNSEVVIVTSRCYSRWRQKQTGNKLSLLSIALQKCSPHINPDPHVFQNSVEFTDISSFPLQFKINKWLHSEPNVFIQCDHRMWPYNGYI